MSDFPVGDFVMPQSLRLWKGIALSGLAGLLIAGTSAFAAEAPPLTEQLTTLGQQAMDQGESALAQSFYKKALELDPKNAKAKQGLEKLGVNNRVGFQDPGDKDEAPAAAPAPARRAPVPAPADRPAAPAEGAAPAARPAPPPAPGVQGAEADAPATPEARVPQATIENQQRLENVRRQQLTADIEERLQRARDLENAGQPEAALDALRLAQNVVRSEEGVGEGVRQALDRRIQAQILSTARAEERIVAQRAEALRLAAASESQERALNLLMRNQETVSALMTQFDMLMAQGQYNVLYNGGLGNIAATTEPFVDARLLAQRARALAPTAAAPRAGMFVAETEGFLAQELAFEQVKEYRGLLTMQDVARAAIPFPDTQVIEYPDAELWRSLSERRILRYGKAVDLLDRDEKTKMILRKLEEPISMSFANETPLEDVLKYIKSATQGANDSGIPIYVDPVGLQEAEKTMTSPVQLDLEGVPLKTTLRLMLKQLGLTYTVKDGLMTITSETADDQPTEIRVYPVADLALIPFSLISGGGGTGGMGMGGMGGGAMGGMGGGGMGGMGGGMGGGGMGGMGGGMGMMSIPPVRRAE